MRPAIWAPPVEPTPEERVVMRLVKRAKLFVFLREHRHEIFHEGFQEELGAIYHDSVLGRPGSPWQPSCRPTPASPTTRSWRRR